MHFYSSQKKRLDEYISEMKQNWKLLNIDRVIDEKLPFFFGKLRLKAYIFSCNSVNFQKFSILFSILKPADRAASFDKHIIFFIFFTLTIFFYKSIIMHIQESISKFFSSDSCSQAPYTALFGPWYAYL